jgi:uncharacterized membrane protein
VSICRFRQVPRGLSGGISLLGSAVSAFAAALCALAYFLVFRHFAGALSVFLLANAGCLLDSILGDLLQEKFSCPRCGSLTEKRTHCDVATVHASGIPHLDNCFVNLISNAFAAVVAVLLLIW